jgi:hypothetical protein
MITQLSIQSSAAAVADLPDTIRDICAAITLISSWPSMKVKVRALVVAEKPDLTITELWQKITAHGAVGRRDFCCICN